jgi:POT family proton-dependent oligopeptide transporter
MSRFPRQLPFIVTTEACERFSYYGVVSILTLYLKNELRMEADEAKETVHLFKMAAYFLPLAGAWLADRWLGRYRTILSLALFYCLGHGTLALFEGTRSGIYTGLGLIALGAGGIKPCVSAFVGDQFPAEQAGLLPQVYGLFYWAINFGAMFAFALVPLIRDHLGFRWAFGVPGLFMALATLVFWAGSRFYIKREPVREFRRQVPEAAAAAGSGPDANQGIPGSRSGNARILGRIAVVLLPVPVFFALYDQVNSSWVLQGSRMVPFALLGYTVDAERIQSFSALLVLFWVPVLTFGVYPLAERWGFRLTTLRRMGAGLVFTALSFVICAGLQQRLEQGETLTLAWQIVPYIVIELGEVLVSATGLEFAYSQAPVALKSVVMSMWLLTTSLGNFLVATITALNAHFVHATGAAEFLFYAGLMLAGAGVFAVIARRYRGTSA